MAWRCAGGHQSTDTLRRLVLAPAGVQPGTVLFRKPLPKGSKVYMSRMYGRQFFQSLRESAWCERGALDDDGRVWPLLINYSTSR